MIAILKGDMITTETVYIPKAQILTITHNPYKKTAEVELINGRKTTYTNVKEVRVNI